MSHTLVCYLCNRSYKPDSLKWRCDCGGYLDVRMDERRIDFEKLDGNRGMWRYEAILPVEDPHSIVSFNEGFTPLVDTGFSNGKVYFKLDYLFPSGSYKDRGASVLLSMVKQLGVTEIIEDSSGNAGSSIALYAARANVKATIYVPADTSASKITQIRASGARIMLIEGSRRDVYERAINDATEKSIYYASHIWNPYFFQGTKTFALELFEQMGYTSPDAIVIPVGNGTLFIGAYLGFEYLKRLGYIKRMPSLIGVQAKNCAPLFASKHSLRFSSSETIAEGIAIENPPRIKQILDIVEETGGDIVVVGEGEIVDAMKKLHRSGFYVEPTSAAAVAALDRITIAQNSSVVVPLTGSGLKTQDKIEKFL